MAASGSSRNNGETAVATEDKHTEEIVDVLKLVLEERHPTKYAFRKQMLKRMQRLDKKAASAKIDTIVTNFMDEQVMTKVRSEEKNIFVSLSKNRKPEKRKLSGTLMPFEPDAVDTNDQPSLSPDDLVLKKRWDDLRRVFNSKKEFPKSGFDHLGLDPDNLDSFRMCISEISNKFIDEEYENVIDYARALLDIYKDSSDPTIRAVTREPSLLKFIFQLLFRPMPVPVVPALMSRSFEKDVDLRDIPELGPNDEKMKTQWESFRKYFNEKKSFKTDALNQSTLNPHDVHQFNDYVEEIQLSYLKNDYERVIDLARAMIGVYCETTDPVIKKKCGQTSLFRFIYEMIFGSSSEVVEGAPPAPDLPPHPPMIEFADIPDLAPADDGMKTMWERFRRVFTAREGFSSELLQDIDCNNLQGYLNNVEEIQTSFFCEDYDHVISLGHSMMDAYQGSTLEEAREIMTERNLLRFIYRIIFT